MSCIEKLLAQYLEEMEKGHSVEECLARHPKRCEELAPLLCMAQRIRSLPKVSPSAAFRQGARTRILSMIKV